MYNRLQSAKSIDEVSSIVEEKHNILLMFLKLMLRCYSTSISLLFVIVCERRSGMGAEMFGEAWHCLWNRLFNIMIFSSTNAWENAYFSYLSCWRFVSLYFHTINSHAVIVLGYKTYHFLLTITKWKGIIQEKVQISKLALHGLTDTQISKALEEPG